MKSVALFLSIILIVNIFTLNPYAASQEVVASFQVKLSDDKTLWLSPGVVYLHKKGADPKVFTKDDEGIAIKFWSKDGFIMRVGISEPTVTTTLQTRRDILVEDIVDFTLKFKIIKQSDGKYEMTVNDIKVNEVNWLSQVVPEGYTQVEWKETQDLLRCSDLSKIPTDNTVFNSTDNAKLDFFIALPKDLEITPDNSVMPFELSAVVLQNSGSASVTGSITGSGNNVNSSMAGSSPSDSSSKISKTNEDVTSAPIFLYIGIAIILVLLSGGIFLMIQKKKKK